MAQPQIHAIARRELASEPGQHRWDDPHSIARIGPPKRKALRENPFAGADDEPVQLLGTLDGCVVGRLDLIQGALELEGEAIPCCWTSQLYVPPEFRRTLLGVKLVLAMQRMYDTVGASGVTRVASSLYQHLRWLTIELRRFVLIRRSGPIVERYLGTGALAASARPVADAALRTHGAVLGAWIRAHVGTFEVHRVDDFPETLAPFIPIRDRPIVGHRSPAWINWLLRSTFDEPPARRALFIVTGRDGEIAGYFLVRARTYERITHREFRNLHLGSLQDWAAFDPALRFDHLAFLAIRELFAWNVDAVEVLVPPDESATGLRRAGFVPVGSMYIHLKGSGESPILRSDLAAQSAWRLRPAEGDNFFS